jgi:putative membrane protein
MGSSRCVASVFSGGPTRRATGVERAAFGLSAHHHGRHFMRKLSLAVAAAGLLGLSAGHAMADLSAADKAFAMKAASGGLTEVQLGQLAQQKATSPQVKQFGSRMVTDHTQANQELMQIAEQANLQLPTQPDRQDNATIQKLRGTSGSAFDSAYTQNMVQDHQQDVAEFRKEAQNGSDPALKSFAQKYLPILQQHLQMAQTLNRAG